MKPALGLLALLVIIVLILLVRQRPAGQVDATRPRPAQSATSERVAARFQKPPGDAMPNGSQADLPAPIEIKLGRLYATYLASPNSGYADVLEVLRPLASYDPTTTDLLKDACTFVALRTELSAQMQASAADRLEMLRWTLKHSPANQHAEVTAKFEKEPAKEILELREADQAIQRVFQNRFETYHGLHGEAVVAELSALTLTNVGPELWIRCDESVSPYPKPPAPGFQLETR